MTNKASSTKVSLIWESEVHEDALVRIDPADIRKKGRVPKNGNIFFTIFQTFIWLKVQSLTPTYELYDNLTYLYLKLFFCVNI